MRVLLLSVLVASVAAQPCNSASIPGQSSSTAIPEDIRGIWTGPFRQGSFQGITTYTIRNTTWSNKAVIRTPFELTMDFEQYACNVTVRNVAGLRGPVVEVWHTSTAGSNALSGRKVVQCVQFSRIDNTTLRSWQNDTTQLCSADVFPDASTTEVNVVTYALQTPRPPPSGAATLGLGGVAHWAAVLAAVCAAWIAQ